MEVILFTDFNKRKNSTKRPDDNTGIRKNVVIKSNFGFENQNQSTKCSITNPSFFLADAIGYVYLKAWDYYYFIDSIEYDINGAQYITCSIDVLASWKESIMNTRAFIKYSSNNYSTLLNDSRIVPLATEIEGTSQQQVPGLMKNVSTVILTTASTDGVNNYAITMSQLNDIAGALIADTSIADAIRIQFGAVADAIRSVRLSPFGNFSTENVNTVKIGTLDLNFGLSIGRLTGDKIGECKGSFSLSMQNVYNDFRRINSNFTEMELYLPFVGVIQLSPFDFLDSDAVNISYVANAITGAIVYCIRNGDGTIITNVSGEFGTTIPLSYVTMTNPIGFFTSLAGVGSGVYGMNKGYQGMVHSRKNIYKAIGANLIASSASDVVGAVSDMFNSIAPTTKNIGGYGGNYGEEISVDAQLTVRCKDSRNSPEELRELYGLPCSKVMSLSSLNGYVETIGFSIDISTIGNIKDMINEALDSGVYLE